MTVRTYSLNEYVNVYVNELCVCLCVGNPLLVQDVENYDPILNPVLNREVRRSGGRVLISLGDQDIDLSPSFTIFLSTRDPSIEFAPDICSRVTFVNFTVMRASLHSQCLNQALRAERPDIDAKRTDHLRLQGALSLSTVVCFVGSSTHHTSSVRTSRGGQYEYEHSYSVRVPHLL